MRFVRGEHGGREGGAGLPRPPLPPREEFSQDSHQVADPSSGGRVEERAGHVCVRGCGCSRTTVTRAAGRVGPRPPAQLPGLAAAAGRWRLN